MNASGTTASRANPLKRAIELLNHGGKARLAGVSGHTRPYLAAWLAQRLSPRPLLWIVPDEAEAEALHLASRFFLREAASPEDPGRTRSALFPLPQLLPYDEISPDRYLVADRLSLLNRLLSGRTPSLIVSSVSSLMRLCPPREAIRAASCLVQVDTEIDRQSLIERLLRCGYLNVPLVEDPGTFSVRGGILDLYSPELPGPARIEFLGDVVESIRTFDPATQRTLSRLESVFIGPVREIFLDEHSVAQAIGEIDALADTQDVPSAQRLATKRALKDRVWFFGIEGLLPAFHPQLHPLLDYFGQAPGLLVEDLGAVVKTARSRWDDAWESFRASEKAGKLAFPPDRFLLSPDELERRLAVLPRLALGLGVDDEPVIDLATRDITGLRAQIERFEEEKDPLLPLTELLSQWRAQGLRVFLVASRPDRARELLSMLERRGIHGRIESEPFAAEWLEGASSPLQVRIVAGEIPGGFVFPALRAVLLPDSEVFGKPAPRRARAQVAKKKVATFKPGDLVVHADFGIGQFQGLCKLGVAGNEGDYLLLVYRGGDRLYLPITRMNLVERYVGVGDHRPLLSKLGGKDWEKTKQKINEQLLEMAHQLIRIHAARHAKPGLTIQQPGEDYEALEASFPYEETEDQRAAIDAVIRDMSQPKVMDRLICGDVGFGKTEVAVRAAYLATLEGRQTAVLVPTTILALQHLTTFRERLEPLGVRVEMVSRLVRPEERRKTLGELSGGKVDVIIGTHRLLGRDVAFHALGLLVIDEEHRFGVKHKEKLKELKNDVDVLTMTATPIPRTLQLSLTGLRDISVIRTPPPGRRSIRTLVTRFSKKVIEEAIRRERNRGGQVFFLHNSVRSLPAMQRFLQRIVPEATTGIAHGQMDEGKLERVMTDFVRRNLDVLICTSIIESGLDIPSANTILVNRADLFGLSQLHQVRGRVGRSHERAYAYFLIPGLSVLTDDARKRLEALSTHSELGSGYEIAAQDMEIRGAGNLLGKAQSGHIAAVGFDLYNRLLERSIMEIKGQLTSGTREPDLSLPVAGYLPEGYVPELDQRLELYARLSRAESEEEVFELEREIADRYGPEPGEVIQLCELMALKTQLRRAALLGVEYKQGKLRFQLDPARIGALDRLVRLAASRPGEVSLDPQGWLTLELAAEQRKAPLPIAREFLRQWFSAPQAPPSLRR